MLMDNNVISIDLFSTAAPAIPFQKFAKCQHCLCNSSESGDFVIQWNFYSDGCKNCGLLTVMETAECYLLHI